MAGDDLRDQDRLRSPLDAVLHLLDRQIVDRDERLVGKVDDVELSEEADGTLRVSGLLLGTAALLPRFGSGRSGPWLLEPSAGLRHERVVAVALVVGRGRPRSMLGYDRRAATGPLPVAWLVRRLHRLDRVTRIDWERCEVDVDGALDDLVHPSRSP
ncbi:hypothetical protein EKO23_23375 [Nocardioides guangzhouensis]|uniref:PRC-barrel domain containing protein n=1 Tax=Nocardioides guangzhouensis TaxID=2497878 RepID=A0A4Q4Z1V9_9ACTN|nr:hypothetical protein [Nocardioides guangzhouensis]RYP81583.1 hypothetical protein EKO23_23375 [Nocardioides guangzhouensis]